MQMNCKHCQDSLWKFFTQELSDIETIKIKEHLQGCPSCRQEAEHVSLLVSALREDIPLPASFSADLHEKLTRAAEEMAAEKPSKQKLSQWGGFKVLAPALVCLALVVGVFSSGLYDQWQEADRILTEPPITTSAPVESDPPTPAITNPVATTSKPTTEVSAPARTEAVPTAEVPVVDTPSPASMEHVPAPASLDAEDTPAGFAIPRQYDRVTCLTLPNTQAFLDGWQTASGYEWENYIIETDPHELLPGIDADATVLQLSSELTESLLSFEMSTSITQDGLSADQSEFLIIITEDEE